MMRTWIDTTFELSDDDDFTVTKHKDCISLHTPGFSGDGHGFCVRLRPTHIPLLKEAIRKLQAVQKTRLDAVLEEEEYRHRAELQAADEEAERMYRQMDEDGDTPQTVDHDVF